jgi:hypothetical protein
MEYFIRPSSMLLFNSAFAAFVGATYIFTAQEHWQLIAQEPAPPLSCAGKYFFQWIGYASGSSLHVLTCIRRSPRHLV